MSQNSTFSLSYLISNINSIVIQDLFIIVILWFVVFPIALLWISGKISLVGIYHELMSEGCLTGEPFWIKFRRMCGCNFALSLPVIAALYTTIDTTLGGSALIHRAALTVLISLAILLVLRLLANPCSFFVGLISRGYQASSQEQVVKLHKENTISFFYSLICASLFILLIRESYDILIHSTISTEPIEFRDFLLLIILFFVVLLVVTLVGEIILRYVCKPVLLTKRAQDSSEAAEPP